MTTQEKVYLDAQATCGLNVGDWVKVTGKAQDHEAGWDNEWASNMDKTVGHVGQIRNLTDVGILVYFGDPINDWWRFPYFVLEKVEKPQHEFKPFDRVLVRDSERQQWSCNFFSHTEDGIFVCVNGNGWIQCIPYEGNEHLAGTTEQPNG